MKPNLDFPLILFDGCCNLCNGAVDFIIRHDRKKQFRFATFQSNIGQQQTSEYGMPEIDSVILVTNKKWYVESDAVLEITSHLGFPWNMAIAVKIFPKKWRDWFYRKIALNRYRWFGKRNSCRVPTADEEKLFLN
jgi:predicted DCC family thiol-disulfide oxidoreductase YuxK